MAKSVLDQLIDLHAEADDQSPAASERRRMVLRQVTDPFMVAADRYGRRDMELFDLLLSRTTHAMDTSLRKLMAMTLVRAGAREEHVRMILAPGSQRHAQFLRRSVVQTRHDILQTLIEGAGDVESDADPTMADANNLTLPRYFTEHLFGHLLQRYITDIAPKVGVDRTRVVERTVQRGRMTVLSSAEATAREEIVSARKTVREWARRQSISDDLLAELLEARAMNEFVFAISTLFDVDIPTSIRLLNDRTFESFAIAAKANGVRRSVFAKTIFGFRHRQGDNDHAERILKTYDRLPEVAAERALRFWRLRVSDLSVADVSAAAGSFAAPASRSA